VRSRSARTALGGFSVIAAVMVGAAIVLLSQSRAQTPSASAEAQALLDERTAGCAVCARMARDVLPGQFFEDAHEFACAVCHHPHVRRTEEEWRAVCSSPECHPRAWTETVFHRLDPKVFVNCQNCHTPHIWKVNGPDCASCHAAFVESSIAIPVTQVAGVAQFSHATHDHLDCSRCHRSVERHAAMTLSDRSDCMECHHGPEARADCAVCHRPGSVAPRALPVNVVLATSTNPRTRSLSFSHDRHSSLPCSECHSGGGSRVQVDCARCHEQHHHPEAQCSTCHETPGPGAHSLSVHETQTCSGSGCHREGLAFDPMSREQRNICAACHTEMLTHHPGRPCAQCHLLPAGEAR
jgi:hypothetical protein